VSCHEEELTSSALGGAASGEGDGAAGGAADKEESGGRRQQCHGTDRQAQAAKGVAEGDTCETMPLHHIPCAQAHLQNLVKHLVVCRSVEYLELFDAKLDFEKGRSDTLCVSMSCLSPSNARPVLL
jgi:hypothetical protein